MMLADPGLVIVEPVEMDEKLHVAIKRKQRVFAERMKGGEKNAGLQKSVLHGLGLLSAIAAEIVAITGQVARRVARRSAMRRCMVVSENRWPDHAFSWRMIFSENRYPLFRIMRYRPAAPSPD
jgi:hypothetical protein